MLYVSKSCNTSGPLDYTFLRLGYSFSEAPPIVVPGLRHPVLGAYIILIPLAHIDQKKTSHPKLLRSVGCISGIQGFAP